MDSISSDNQGFRNNDGGGLPAPTGRYCRVDPTQSNDAKGIRASNSRWGFLGRAIPYTVATAESSQTFYLNRRSAINWIRRNHDVQRS